MLGLENVFLMFAATAYVALACKTLFMSSVISNPVVHRPWVFAGNLMELNTELNWQLEVKGSKGICANREEEVACSSTDEDQILSFYLHPPSLLSLLA